MNSGIYKITAPSGDFYIGSAVNIKRRWHEHRTSLRKGNHHNVPLQNAANKYGLNNLQFSVIEHCAPEDLVNREQFAIDSLDPQYNTQRTAGSSLGMKYSDEVKEKVRQAAINISDETRELRRQAALRQWSNKDDREKIVKAIKSSDKVQLSIKKAAAALSEKPISDETRKRMSEAAKRRKRKPMSDETKRKLSESSKARWAKGVPDETRENMSKSAKARWQREKGEPN